MTALSETKRYQAYPEYKDSGVDWVGSIPSHWIVTSLKRYTYVKGGVAFSSDLFGDVGKPVIRIGDIKQDGSISLESCKYVPEVVAENSQECLVSNGQLLMAMTGATIGKAGIYSGKYPALVNQRVGRFEVYDDKLSYRFLWYVLKTLGYQEYIRLTAFGGAQPNISDTAMVAYDSAFPPLDEQTPIANFLDHETAKIDTLIDKQQQLIKLLKEKRQAVISHAVTKGLNSATPMKDSGVEWLGEVPEHWDVCLFKYKCSEVTDGAHISPETNGGEHYFVSIRDIKDGVINFDGALLTSPSSYQYLVKTGCMPFEGDVLFSKDGTIGQTAITPSQIDFVVASSLIIIRPDRAKVTPEFLDFILQSSLVKEQVESFVKGAALRRLSIQNLLKVFGVFPPIDEQIEIVEYIQSKLVKFQELEIQANKQVILLRERRTALISAAVTGKIDVRNWQATATQESQQQEAS
ncbi:restriction endonuclease subunit S [Vibrio splendidus]